MGEDKTKDIDNLTEKNIKIIEGMLRDSQTYLQTDNPVELTKLYGEIYDGYDPDSSPFAWEYYHTIYKNIIEFQDNNDGYYTSYHSKKAGITYTRNIAVFKWYNKCKSKETQCEEETNLKQTKKACLKKDKHLEFGGDCSFNFKTEGTKAKFNTFKEIIEKFGKNQEEKNTMINKLNFCAMMHHSPLNFALMPRTGNFNGVKQGIGYKEITPENNTYKTTLETGKTNSGHDRLDSFLACLNDFYIEMDKNAETGKNKSVYRNIANFLSNGILNKCTVTLLPYVLEFLLDVQEMNEKEVGTRNYVALFYPWVFSEYGKEKKLFERLIKNGQKPIKNFGDILTIIINDINTIITNKIKNKELEEKQIKNITNVVSKIIANKRVLKLLMKRNDVNGEDNQPNVKTKNEDIDRVIKNVIEEIKGENLAPEGIMEYLDLEEVLLSNYNKIYLEMATSVENLNAYMDLAIDYWTAAAKYYNEQKSKKQNKTESDTE